MTPENKNDIDIKMVKCAADDCSRTFPAGNGRRQYCSSTCRAKASTIRNGMIRMENKDTQMPLSGLTPQAQYIINHLEKERQRWENMYQQERTERKKAKEDNGKLREELAQIKVDQKLSENKQPSGLNGFLSNPFVQELAPHIGPVLGEIARKFLVQGNAGVGQIEGGPDIGTWIASLPEALQQKIHVLFGQLSQQQPEKMDQIITGFLNILKHGTTITAPNPASASAAF